MSHTIPIAFPDQDLAARVARLEAALSVPPEAPFGMGNAASWGMDAVVSHIAAHYRLTREQIMGKRKFGFIVWPRMVAVYFQREILGARYEAIGKYWNTDHSNAQSSCKRIRDRMATEPKFAAHIEYLKTSTAAELAKP